MLKEQKESHEPSLKKKTANGLLWGGIGSLFQQVVGLVFGILIARILSPDDFGLIAMLAIFTAVANTIMDSGFSTALINKKNITHEDYNAVFWFSLIAGIFLYIVLFFTAPIIAYFFDQPILVNLSRLLFLSFIFSSLGIAHNAYLLKNIMAKQRSIIDIVSVFISGFAGLILALRGYVYWGLAIQAITQCFIATFLRWYFSPWKPSININFLPLKEMFNFSYKVFITNIMLQANANILSTIFGKSYGEQQTGIYSQGFKWGSLGTSVIVSMINGIALPVLTKATDEKERQKNILRKMLRFGALISFPSLLGFAFIGKEFILITVGEKWIDCLPFVQIYCFLGSVSFIWYLYTSVLLSHGKSDIYMWGVIVLFIISTLLSIGLLPFGMIKVAIAYILCQFLCLFFWHYFVCKIIRLSLWDIMKDISPYLIITIICISVGWLVTKDITNIYISISSKIVIVATLYVFILWKSNSTIVKESYNYIKEQISHK